MREIHPEHGVSRSRSVSSALLACSRSAAARWLPSPTTPSRGIASVSARATEPPCSFPGTFAYLLGIPSQRFSTAR